MALPADFSKIFGSTATGGLTPIGDVNYAKGWEFVGSNPPTKNDFSYLQNLSDLKSQWLYSNKLQRTDPFGDIKADGAVQAALENLGLGEAAKRNVGTGANQIPDMSLFASINTATAAAQKFPSGLILQCGQLNGHPAPSSSYSMTFPMTFTKVIAVVVTLNVTGASGQPTVSATNIHNTGFDITVSPGSGYGSSANAYYIAMGY